MLIILLPFISILTVGILIFMYMRRKTSFHRSPEEEQLFLLPGNAKQYHPDHLTPLSSSPLNGKHLLFLGSSVTYGAASLGVSMADYLHVLDKCDIVKEAVSGTTLADLDCTSYLSRLKRLDRTQRFDIIICQLSTNDATKGIPLGEISSSHSPDDFDSKTIIGSMETIISYCQTVWDCPIVFYTGTRYDSLAYQAMVDMLPGLKDKWSISVLDLWNDPNMNAVSPENYALYMNDGIHPTQAGYLIWWLPKFQHHLYSLCIHTSQPDSHRPH